MGHYFYSFDEAIYINDAFKKIYDHFSDLLGLLFKFTFIIKHW